MSKSEKITSETVDLATDTLKGDVRDAVLIVVADPEPFSGERAEAKPDADEPGLPLDDDGPVADNTRAAA